MNLQQRLISEFNEKFGKATDDDEASTGEIAGCDDCYKNRVWRNKIKDWMLQALSRQRSELKEKVEGMKKSECVCHMSGGYFIHCAECKNTFTCGWNTSLTDILAVIDSM